MLPTDGIVKSTALEITKGSKSDLDKAKAIYDWIVENTQRNPKTRGCGTGDIQSMLETGNLSGKCADLNALFVGLARAVGLPARDVPTGFASLIRNMATRVWARAVRYRRHSIAVLKSGCPVLVGCRLIRPMCARLLSKRKQA